MWDDTVRIRRGERSRREGRERANFQEDTETHRGREGDHHRILCLLSSWDDVHRAKGRYCIPTHCRAKRRTPSKFVLPRLMMARRLRAETGALPRSREAAKLTNGRART